MIGKKAVTGAAIALAAIICAGAATHDDGKNAVLVEEVYVVKPGKWYKDKADAQAIVDEMNAKEGE